MSGKICILPCASILPYLVGGKPLPHIKGKVKFHTNNKVGGGIGIFSQCRGDVLY